MSRPARVALTGIVATVIALLGVEPALAHGFSSVVYVDVARGDDGRVVTKLRLEYDLFVVSTADAGKDDPLFRAGTAAFDDQDDAGMAAALDAHADQAIRYVTDRFSVSSDGAACTATRAGDFTMGRPGYARASGKLRAGPTRRHT